MKNLINKKIESIINLAEESDQIFINFKENAISNGLYSTKYSRFVKKILVFEKELMVLKSEISKIEEATSCLLKKW